MGKLYVIDAPHPEHGRLYAAVDPDARYVAAQVCEFRFSATLAPFRSEEEARAALSAAGGTVAGFAP